MNHQIRPSLRSILREKTKSAHESLDGSMATLDPFSSTIGYAIYLSGMHHLYTQNAGDLLWTSRESGLQDNTRDLCMLIEKDLDALSMAVAKIQNSQAQVDRAGTEACRAASSPEVSMEKSWGVAYVIEGSSMGARHIVRQVESNNASNSPTLPTAFLASVATESYERWPKFTAALDESNCESTETVAAACETFASAKAIFQDLTRNCEREISTNTTTN